MAVRKSGEEYRIPSDLWKFVATGALTAIFGFIGHNVLIPPQKIPDHIITQEQLIQMMPGMIAQFSPYTSDQKDISSKLTTINDRLAKIEAHEETQSRDIARIAEKNHVYASPAP